MAPQFPKKSALTAALVSLGFAFGAVAQPTPSTTQGGGPTPSTSKAGGPVPSTSKSGGPTPAASSATDTSAKASAKGSLDHADRKFIEDTAKDGMAEVEMGQVAQQKAQNADVKAFAAKMVQDHGKANDELKTLASSKGVQLPTDVDKSHKHKAESLGKKAAGKFDHEYMEEMVKEHKKDVKAFEKAAKNAKDADVRAFASKTLPTLQEHLKMAEAAEKSAKGGGKSASAMPSKPAATAGSTAGSAAPTSGGAPSGSSGATGAKTK